MSSRFTPLVRLRTTPTGSNENLSFAPWPKESLWKLATASPLPPKGKKNEEVAKNTFEQRVKETKQKAIDENKKNADKHGTIITQDIDNDGNLVGVGHTTTEQTFNSEEISVADIRSELFDGENVVIGKSDYGQSQLISGPFANKKD